MFWIFLFLAFLLALNAAPPDPNALASPLFVYGVSAVLGLLTGWLFWWRAGWNAHVEFKRSSAIEKAESEAAKERK